MTSQSEGRYAGEFLLYEADPRISRENVTVTVAAATKLQAGHVLAVLTSGGKYVEYDNSGSDGSETAAAVLYTGELDNEDGEAPADFEAVVVKREATVRKGDLSWFSGADDTAKNAAYVDMAVAHLIARD